MNRHRKPRKDLTEWAKERQDIIRGVSGGFLFGIPLIYTMEVWWIGSYLSPEIVLFILIVTYVIVVFLNRNEGFRPTSPDGYLDAAIEAVEALAIGLFCSTFMLILLRRITLNTPLDESLGKIIFDGVPFAFGVALARLILSPEPSSERQLRQQEGKDKQRIRQSRQRQRGLFQMPANETVISYLVSLLASVLMLWFFQQLTFSDPGFLWINYTILLGLPATIGGAAGRLAV